jgi:hypothetical protein
MDMGKRRLVDWSFGGLVERSSMRVPAWIALAAIALSGCGSGAPEPAAEQGTQQTAVASGAPTQSTVEMPVPTSNPAPALAPIRLGSDEPATAAGGGTSGGASVAADPAASRQALLNEMMPLQIMLGTWRGTTQTKIGDFNGLDAPAWVWDFQTDRNHPAMVMNSEESAYFRAARLTWLAESKQFQMTTTDQDGRQRSFQGTFSQVPETVQGDDNKPQQTYKLALIEVNAADPKDQWQIVFNQQRNDRYLMELSKKRGGNFARFETVATQREGTSFALSDDDYGDRKCVISGGLGTMQVSYQGKSYWVCCTGCKAAFEDDPATWIAEFEAKQKAGKK